MRNRSRISLGQKFSNAKLVVGDNSSALMNVGCKRIVAVAASELEKVFFINL